MKFFIYMLLVGIGFVLQDKLKVLKKTFEKN